MPPRRSSNRTQQPAHRRPRVAKACSFCRIAKQRCEPMEYDKHDQSCRRCVSQGLECSLPRVARSRSPSSGLGGQGGPIRHPNIVPHSAGGATRELTPGSETNVRYTLQPSELVQFPMERWSPLVMCPEQRQGSSPGQPPLQTPSLPAAPSMRGYQQSFPNVAQGSNSPESSYFPQDYYEQTMPCNIYMASDGVPNLGYALEPDNAGTPVDEQDASPPYR